MYLFLSSSKLSPIASLEEPDDCSSFHITIQNLSEDNARQVLEDEDVGELADHDTAWITITALYRLAQGRVQPDWQDRFNGMLHYAERKGWLRNDRAAVRGHCEWEPEKRTT
jgi:hypothetical protein